jgi:excisionase family DNA binding protein
MKARGNELDVQLSLGVQDPVVHTVDPRPGQPRPGTAPQSGPAGVLPILLTMGEVAAVLRTSRKAVYAMAERAQLPGVARIGRRLLVRRDDLLSWLDERRAASPGGSRR